MKRTLYVSDMDGTLLSADSRVSAFTASALNRLAAAGVFFTVATARTAATVEPLLSGVATAPLAVVMTGAALWDRRAGRYTDCRFFEPATLDRALDACLSAGIHPFIYTLEGDSILDVYHGGKTLNAYERSFYTPRADLPLKRFHLSSAAPSSSAARTLLLFAMGPRQAIGSAASAISSRTPCHVSSYPDIFDPETSLLEVFAPGVSKAGAVGRLKEMFAADELTVFGDNLNDLPMFAGADISVAVANAQPEVLRAATLCIGANTDDAVARYISGREGIVCR